MKLPQKVALIQGGLGAEKEISLISGQAVARVLDEIGLAYQALEAGPGLSQNLLELKPDVAFLAVHGKYAEDGIIQSLCEYLKIPYTGSGVLSSAICMDKCFFKDMITKYHIPTPDYQNWNLQKWDISQLSPPSHLDFPLVVKPAREGSSLGISICHTEKDWIPALTQARKYDKHIVLESYIKGTELAVSFLNDQILTPVEIVPKTGFYDYKNKYTAGATDYILPPRVSANIIKQCQENTLQMVKALQIRTYCRADFIVTGGTAWMIEVNTLPGLTSHSLLPKSAQYDGLDFKTVVQTILKGASLDYENRH